MKIVTVLRHVPDAEAPIRVTDGHLEEDGVTFVLDGMDEYAVEAALRLREGGLDADVLALALGGERVQEALRSALALGADRATRLAVDDAVAFDPLAAARVLAAHLREEAPDLVLLGGRQADWDSAALGPALAEALDWPASDWTTELSVDGGTVRTRHDRDGGSEALDMPLPAVVTTQQGLNEPRYPTLPNIMKAKRKPLETVQPEAGAATRRVRARERVRIERRGALLEGAPEEAAAALVRRLREEARVL